MNRAISCLTLIAMLAVCPPLVTHAYEQDAPSPGLPMFVAGYPIDLGAAETTSPSFAANIGTTLDWLGTINVNVAVLSISIPPITPEDAPVNLVDPDPAATSSDESLRIAIQAAHTRDIAVMIQPRISLSQEPTTTSPPPMTDPPDAGTWFDAYTVSILHYAQIAGAEQAAGFIVDTDAEDFPIGDGDWADLVGLIRHVYAGNLIYAMNSHSTAPAFADQFDMVMLALDGQAVSDAAPLDTTIRDMAAATNHPVMISAFYDDGESNATTPPGPGVYTSLCALVSTAETSESGGTMRSAPESFAPPLLTLQPGSLLILSGLPTVFSGVSWQPVRDEKTGYTGFMRTEELGGRPILAGAILGSGQPRPEAAAGKNGDANGMMSQEPLASCYAERLGKPVPAPAG